jgi:FkbM family methyltransferase
VGPEGSNLRISENGQEFFVLDRLYYKQNGYFVDIGASDGVTANNTYVLEKFYKWNGICADPNPSTLKSLCGARDVIISDLCVHSETGKILPFQFLNDQNLFYGWNFRSGLKGIIEDPGEDFAEINVLSISLNDLLELYRAPKTIDYLSLDVEGNEFNILSRFNFEEYHVNCLTVEHDFGEMQQNIRFLLESKGFELVDNTSCEHEDWFVNKNLKINS